MQTKPCPDCGAKMILVFAMVLPNSDPPKASMDWFCGCGHWEIGPTFALARLWRGADPGDTRLAEWKKANERTET